MRALPAGERDRAGESIVATLAAVEDAEAVGGETAVAAAAIVDPAREAFVGAMHLTVVGTAGCAVVAAVVVLVWLPGRRRVG